MYYVRRKLPPRNFFFFRASKNGRCPSIRSRDDDRLVREKSRADTTDRCRRLFVALPYIPLPFPKHACRRLEKTNGVRRCADSETAAIQPNPAKYPAARYIGENSHATRMGSTFSAH